MDGSGLTGELVGSHLATGRAALIVRANRLCCLAATFELREERDLFHGVQRTLTGGVGPFLHGVELEGNVDALPFAVPGVIPFADFCEIGVGALFLDGLAVEGNGLEAKVGFQIPAGGPKTNRRGVGLETRLKGGLLLLLNVLFPQIANDGNGACSQQQRQENQAKPFHRRWIINKFSSDAFLYIPTPSISHHILRDLPYTPLQTDESR
jgi:hypothetical protein